MMLNFIMCTITIYLPALFRLFLLYSQPNWTQMIRIQLDHRSIPVQIHLANICHICAESRRLNI